MHKHITINMMVFILHLYSVCIKFHIFIFHLSTNGVCVWSW